MLAIYGSVGAADNLPAGDRLGACAWGAVRSDDRLDNALCHLIVYQSGVAAKINMRRRFYALALSDPLTDSIIEFDRLGCMDIIKGAHCCSSPTDKEASHTIAAARASIDDSSQSDEQFMATAADLIKRAELAAMVLVSEKIDFIDCVGQRLLYERILLSSQLHEIFDGLPGGDLFRDMWRPSARAAVHRAAPAQRFDFTAPPRTKTKAPRVPRSVDGMTREQLIGILASNPERAMAGLVAMLLKGSDSRASVAL
jgi:hypothetical protein